MKVFYSDPSGAVSTTYPSDPTVTPPPSNPTNAGGTPGRVEVGDAATQGLRGGPQVQTNPQTPGYIPGQLVPMQGESDGSLKVSDQELKRDRTALEEMRLFAETTEYLLLRGRSAEVWVPTVDRRGGSGQRGVRR